MVACYITCLISLLGHVVSPSCAVAEARIESSRGVQALSRLDPLGHHKGLALGWLWVGLGVDSAPTNGMLLQ